MGVIINMDTQEALLIGFSLALVLSVWGILEQLKSHWVEMEAGIFYPSSVSSHLPSIICGTHLRAPV